MANCSDFNIAYYRDFIKNRYQMKYFAWQIWCQYWIKTWEYTGWSVTEYYSTKRHIVTRYMHPRIRCLTGDLRLHYVHVTSSQWLLSFLQVMMTYALRRRLQSTSIRVLSLHPGGVDSGFQNSSSDSTFWRIGWKFAKATGNECGLGYETNPVCLFFSWQSPKGLDKLILEILNGIFVDVESQECC